MVALQCLILFFGECVCPEQETKCKTFSTEREKTHIRQNVADVFALARLKNYICMSTSYVCYSNALRIIFWIFPGLFKQFAATTLSVNVVLPKNIIIGALLYQKDTLTNP